MPVKPQASTYSPVPQGEATIDVDVAIVGGGVSGLYAALRLLRSDASKRKRIAVFEATNRFGGRVNTIAFPEEVLGHVADFGAMRYIPTQVLINGLIKGLQMGGDVYSFNFPTDAYLVRGRHLAPTPGGNGELYDQFPSRDTKIPSPQPQDAYRWLREDEKGRTPGELMALAIAKLMGAMDVVTGEGEFEFMGTSMPSELKEKINNAGGKGLNISFGDLDPEDWLAFKKCATYEGTEIFKLGFWDLIQSQLSSEAFALLEAGMGYQTIIGTWNAADAIPWFLADFSFQHPEDPSRPGEYLSLRGGMGRLTDRLAESVQSADGHLAAGAPGSKDSRLYENYLLRELVINEDGSMTLEFDLRYTEVSYGAAYGYRKIVHGPHKKSVRAKQVILAMSPGAIQAVKIVGVDVSELEERLLTVTAHPLLKMFMYFRRPWWWAGLPNAEQLKSVGTKDAGQGKLQFSAHRTFTDLPLRMFYSCGPVSPWNSVGEPDLSRGATERATGVVMAYCDARHAAYWDSLKKYQSVIYKTGDLTKSILGSKNPVASFKLLEQYGVSEAFAARAHEQLWRAYNYRIESGACSEIGQPTKTGLARGEGVPIAETVLYMNWGRRPFYGGWHSWNIGVSSGDVKRTIVRPLEGYEVYVCGEAFSSDQGWIEGALRSAERALRVMGIDAPDWIDVEANLKRQRYRSFDDYVHW